MQTDREVDSLPWRMTAIIYAFWAVTMVLINILWLAIYAVCLFARACVIHTLSGYNHFNEYVMTCNSKNRSVICCNNQPFEKRYGAKLLSISHCQSKQSRSGKMRSDFSRFLLRGQLSRGQFAAISCSCSLNAEMAPPLVTRFGVIPWIRWRFDFRCFYAQGEFFCFY